MNATNRALLDRALQLPERDRTEMVERLLDSLSPDPDEAEEAWIAELERRSAQFRQSRRGAMSWEKLKDLQ